MRGEKKRKKGKEKKRKKRETPTELQFVTPNRRNYLEEPVLDGNTRIKWMLKEVSENVISIHLARNTVMRRLTTGIRSEKCVVRRFRRCANEPTYYSLLDT